MNLELAQSARQTHRFILHQSMTLLALSASDLTEFLLETAEENPLLLVGRPRPRSLMRGGATDVIEQTATDKAQGLFAHVEAELRELLAAGGKLGQVITCLIEELDPCGWITADLSKIGAQLGITEDLVEAALRLIQMRVSPTGLFARNLTECLRLQLEAAGPLSPEMAVVLDNLSHLKNGDLDTLVSATGLSPNTVRVCLKRLRTLDPKPGAQFDSDLTLAREPDARVSKFAGRWQIRFNRDVEPSVEIAQMPQMDDNPSLDEYMRQARGLKKAVAMRRSATCQVIDALIARQTAYLERGAEALCPLRMVDLGESTGFHASTVSRVLNGYLIETPHGIVEAKSLCPGAASRSRATHSKAQVINRLRSLIEAEDPSKPLTDAGIASLLASEGIAVSRRVAANYRQTCGYPRAALRHR